MACSMRCHENVDKEKQLDLLKKHLGSVPEEFKGVPLANVVVYHNDVLEETIVKVQWTVLGKTKDGCMASKTFRRGVWLCLKGKRP